MDINTIRKKILSGGYSITTHAFIQAIKDGISLYDIEYAIMDSEIIEDYPKRFRCLIYGVMKNNIPLHIVCDYHDFVRNPGKDIIIVTVYIPDKDKWIKNKIRKRGE